MQSCTIVLLHLNTVNSSAMGSVKWAGGHCIGIMLKDFVKSFTIGLLHCKCCEKQFNGQGGIAVEQC